MNKEEDAISKINALVHKTFMEMADKASEEMSASHYKIIGSEKDTEELNYVLTKTVKTLVNTVGSLQRRIKKAVTANLNNLERAEIESRRCNTNLTKKVKRLEKSVDSIKEALVNQIRAFRGIEDTFYTLYHNIKQNQWLYATDEEKKCKDSLDLKKHYKAENKKEKAG